MAGPFFFVGLEILNTEDTGDTGVAERHLIAANKALDAVAHVGDIKVEDQAESMA